RRYAFLEKEDHGQPQVSRDRRAARSSMKASALIAQCLENEGVRYVFGLPGEEILDILDSLLDSRAVFILTRHAQGAAFMAKGSMPYDDELCLLSSGLQARDYVACGFMNCQELETAERLGLAVVNVIFRDGAYNLIRWKQQTHFGRKIGGTFGNPDFVELARAFGAKGFRVESARACGPILAEALAHPGPSIVDVPVDYSDNAHLT